MTDLTISESILNFHLTTAVSETIHFSIPETTLTLSCVGPPGPQGLPGGSIDGFPFAYNEVSPILGLTATAGKMVLEARIVIETPFNGTGAALSIGDNADHESLLPIAYNNPLEAGSYTIAPLKVYADTTILKLFMNPGTDPSQGAGRFFILLEG